MARQRKPHWMPIGAVTLLAESSCMAELKQEQADMKAHESGKPSAPPIGVATQEPDGTIILMLHAEGENGEIGDAQFRYPPSDKDYGMIKAYVGRIPPGGSVPVAPLPDP